MKIGDKIRYKIAFCAATNPNWFLHIGTIVKLRQVREFWIASIIWENLNSEDVKNPAETFTFNLDLI